jgi:CheY-like chemotaxis protein/anti-sigma regulatory factor (Ser/Thr protein kinase)
VVGDGARLRQVVTNLVGNAVKFTTEGHVLVSVDCDEAAVSPRFSIVVEDTGPGIPPDQQARVFDKFHQVDGSSTRAHEGTGLGLAIAAELVQRMGGRIELRSEVGSGSVFTVQVSLELREAEDASAVSLPFADLEGLRVLVIDDHPVNRRILEEQLSRWGMRVSGATGANDALRALQDAEQANEPFELALVDYRMPELDGIELARRIRTALRRPPQLVLSTSLDKGLTAHEISEAGFRGYLLKPSRCASRICTRC